MVLGRLRAKYDVLTAFIECGLKAVSDDFDLTNESDLRTLFYDVFIERIIIGSEEAANFCPIVEAFVEFLHDTGRLVAPPQSLITLLQKPPPKWLGSTTIPSTGAWRK